MSRSRKKPYYTISKAWDEFKERVFRRLVKAELHNIELEIAFDPDADFEASLEYQKMGDYGTRMGWDVKPADSDDTWMAEDYLKAQRK